MIGIIGAMDVEVEGIRKNIENIKTEEISGMKFSTGKLFGKDVVVVKSGEGKVNSAMATQTMILKYKTDFIINSGVAGGLHPDMKVMDIAIAENVCQHDYDITPLGYEPGFLPQVEGVKMVCDNNLNEAIESCTKTVCTGNIFKGTIASGDQFIASDSQRNKIKNVFNRWIDNHLWQLSWFSAKLQFNLFFVVVIDMNITKGVYEFSRLQITHLCHHHSQ